MTTTCRRRKFETARMRLGLTQHCRTAGLRDCKIASMVRRVLKAVLVALLVIFLAIQLVPVNRTNPPFDRRARSNDPHPCPRT